VEEMGFDESGGGKEMRGRNVWRSVYEKRIGYLF